VLFSDLTFQVEPGMMLLVSGVNGIGKSTLLKILTGLWEASSGTVTWDGTVVKPGDPFFLSQLLYIGHKIGIQPILTPLENLKWLLRIHSIFAISEAEIKFALQTIGLKGFEDIPCEQLSKGQQYRVALARLWIKPPRYWILDEPLTALDESGRELLMDRFFEHLKQQGYLVMTSHYKFALNEFNLKEVTLPYA